MFVVSFGTNETDAKIVLNKKGLKILTGDEK